MLPDDALKAQRHEVQRLLGRCLLRIQQYERLIKSIIAHNEISRPAHALEEIKAARVADAARKTLGTLVRELLGSHVVTNKIDASIKEATGFPEDVTSFAMRMHLELSDADFARIENELKELVDLRNKLVHNFIEQHDIWSLDGCRGAQDALVDNYNRIDQHFEQLRGWAEQLEQSRRAMAEFLQSDVGYELVVNGISPDGTVAWPAAGIVYALREAAGVLAVDGWASVAKAGKRIAELQPEQLPAKYGCRSWKQVVHESRVFELRYFEVGGENSAWYREKERSANTC
jgi:hypothetical protein